MSWTWTGLIACPWTPTVDGRAIFTGGLFLGRGNRTPVFISLPPFPAGVQRPRNPIVGACSGLNTTNEGDLFADIEFYYDDDQVIGLYPEMDVDYHGRLVAIGLGTGPLWRELRPITRPGHEPRPKPPPWLI